MGRIKKPQNTIWQPHPGSQVDFLKCPYHEVLLSGNRGGGKTDCLIMDFLQGVGVGYGVDWMGILFRTEYTQLTDVINKSQKWITQIFPGATYNGSEHKWTFPEGESLYLRYMRVPADYYSYHGHNYCVNSNTYVETPTGNRLASTIKVGDLVGTLQGGAKVTKVLRSIKPAVTLSLLDSCSHLVGQQQQGVIHPVLTNHGWQRVGLACLSHISPLCESWVPLVTEVYKFLVGIHQELILSSEVMVRNPLEYSIGARNRVQFSSLHQILRLLPGKSTHADANLVFRSYTDLDIHKVFSSGTNEESVFSEYLHSNQPLQLLQKYCKFLIESVSRAHLVHTHLLHSILYQGSCRSASPVSLRFQWHQQVVPGKHHNQLQMYVQSLLMQDQIAWSGTFAYVQYLRAAVVGSQFDYHGECDSSGAPLPRILGIYQGAAPLRNDAQQLDFRPSLEHLGTQGIQERRSPDAFSQTFYIHPYTHGYYETTAPAQEFSFSVVPCETSADMIDFEIQGDNHYLTELITEHTTSGAPSSQGVSVVNQNCWQGWEELTTWPTDECYKLMMSTNRSPNPNVPRKIRATCNPSGIGHSWVKSRFIDATPAKKAFRDPITGNTRTHIVSSLSENTTLLAADPNYKNTLMMAVQDDPMKYKAWIEGSWDIVDGGFFADLWDPKIHVLPRFPIPRSWDIVRSFDWGSSKPWSVTYLAECNGDQPDSIYGLPYLPKGSTICIMEVYGWNGTANEGDRATSQEIAERVLQVDAALVQEYGCQVRIGPADTSIWEVRDGTSIAKNMSNHGLWWTKAYKGSGSRVSGWSLMRTMLGAAKRKDLEHPHLYFSEAARHHIRTIPIMQHDPKKPEDINSDLEDHCCDSARYGLARKLNKLQRRAVKS